MTDARLAPNQLQVCRCMRANSIWICARVASATENSNKGQLPAGSIRPPDIMLCWFIRGDPHWPGVSSSSYRRCKFRRIARALVASRELAAIRAAHTATRRW